MAAGRYLLAGIAVFLALSASQAQEPGSLSRIGDGDEEYRGNNGPMQLRFMDGPYERGPPNQAEWAPPPEEETPPPNEPEQEDPIMTYPYPNEPDYVAIPDEPESDPGQIEPDYATVPAEPIADPPGIFGPGIYPYTTESDFPVPFVISPRDPEPVNIPAINPNLCCRVYRSHRETASNDDNLSAQGK
ncbi:circumsporozoite protein-like [Physella acuta]|uniref:circumsporozoite protein-like n=1 Tax=Physella acuta TaxID=109671 RepID=UPI0027DBD83B|nr:circumsporozoite protein-like [Physella acuta]